MKTDEIRAKYLDFFQSKGHTLCVTDVMVPKWDKSVLFTPAGMNQFKDHFLGKVELEFTRATSSQKCLRTGDIENVGRTAYHHTFFEMLGNFSFGDYFKREAINWAWEFLTDSAWLGLEKDRLSVTVYNDDDEAADIWNTDVGLSHNRIKRLDELENFWPAGAPSHGPDGVCGPCSEIFYHPENGPECEIWNLVFTQFNRVGSPPDNLEPLPSKNIDTGMGLERTAATLQNVSTNYHIDTLMPIVQAAAEVCHVKYEPDSDNGRRLRRITDHVRACSLAIHENVYPGSQKEESVVRLLLRRAVLQGYEMGLRDPFLFQLVPVVVEQLESPYPELKETIERVASVIKAEENSFYSLVERGVPRIEEIAQQAIKAGKKKLNSAHIAEAYQTHGVPAEIAESVAEEHGLIFDWAEFRQAMGKHGEVSNSGEKTVMSDLGPLDDIKREVKSTTFLGFDATETQSVIRGLLNEGELTQSRERTLGTSADLQYVVVDASPFFAESGGQVGDTGVIVGPTGKFEITDTQKTGDVIVHHGHVVQGTIAVGESVTLSVDARRRDGIRRAHSATHILHFSLQKHLGQHAQQRGSKVSDDHLRFDFANMDPVPEKILAAIESQANQCIVDATPISAQTLSLEKAKQQGAMMLFGEKYPDPVRMISIGEFSKELCGGIHLDNSGNIDAFEIVAEENVGAGTRRIQALTGRLAEEHQRKIRQAVEQLSGLLGVSENEVPVAAASLTAQLKRIKKQLTAGRKSAETSPRVSNSIQSDAASLAYLEIREILRKTAHELNVPVLDVVDRIKMMMREVESQTKALEKIAAAGQVDVDELIQSACMIGDVQLVVKELPGANAGLMKQLIDQLRKKTNPIAVLFVTSPDESKVVMAAGLSRDLVAKGLHAGDWIGAVAPVVGGRGGGKPDLAQAGGKDSSKIGEAIKTAVEFIKSKQLG